MLKLLKRRIRHAQPPDLFSSKHLATDLKNKSVKGGLTTIAGESAKFLLRTGSTVVLARLLTPEDYGLFGMATIFLGFAELFKDAGLSSATVQQEEINHKQISTLFWINIIVSLVGASIIAILSPYVSQFYGEPRLTAVILALSINFFLSGLAIQHSAILKRQMQFAKLAQIQLCASFVSIIIGITSAYYGASYWSLILMQFTFTITWIILIWMSCPWFPGLPSWQSGVGSMLSYGGNLTAFNAVNYFSRNFDNIIIGKYWGSQELGLYSKAYQLILLPIQQINSPLTSVAMPALSRLQNDPEKYCRYYYKAILSITFIGMPLTCFMFASAHSLILVLLGEKWLDVVPIFRWLMPAAFLGTFNVATGWVYQSLGRTGKQFRWGLLGSSLNVLVFLISVPWGAVGVAAAFGMTRLLMLVPRFRHCYEDTPLTLSKLMLTLSRPAFASVGAAALLMGAIAFLPDSMDASIILLGGAVIYALLYLTIWMVLPDGKATLLEIVQTLSDIKKKKKEK